MTRPTLLDLYCGGGGASAGYAEYFDVTGVDLMPQRAYPFKFIRGDALEVLRDPAGLAGYDAVHASPPCKLFTTGRGDRHALRLFEPHSDYLTPTLRALAAVRVPWVVENVPGAPMPADSVRLCGSSFGLDVRRHRLFCSNVPLTAPPCRHEDQEAGRFPSLDNERRVAGMRAAVVGVHGSPQYPNHYADACAAMGIDWMPWEKLTQAVPPAYTECIGAQLLRHVNQNQEGELMIATPERLHDLRRVSRTPVTYPSDEFDAARAFLAAAVPELLDTIEALCHTVLIKAEAVQ